MSLSLLPFERLRKPKRSQCAFEHVMRVATDVADREPTALFDLIAALLRPLQSEHLIAVAEREQHAAPGSLEAELFFFDIRPYVSVSDSWIQPTPSLEIRLATDPVLPTAWERRRFVSAVVDIGEGRPCGPWRQDPNHRVSVWLPWSIAFVLGGNHSISAGILRGEGVVTATEVFDIGHIFDLVECDGHSYRRRDTGKVVSPVHDHRRAAVYEIGRLIRDLGVSKARAS